MMNRNDHPHVPKVLVAFAIYLGICAVGSLLTIPEFGRKAAYSATIFAGASLLWAYLISKKHESALSLAIYTLVIAMLAYMVRGLMNLMRFTQGAPEYLSASIWGWIMCMGSIITLFIIFRLTRVQAPPRKRES